MLKLIKIIFEFIRYVFKAAVTITVVKFIIRFVRLQKQYAYRYN